MPDEGDEAAAPDEFDGPAISGYGVASAALGALSVAAIALAAVIWVAHRSDVDDRGYQSRIMQAAVGTWSVVAFAGLHFTLRFAGLRLDWRDAFIRAQRGLRQLPEFFQAWKFLEI